MVHHESKQKLSRGFAPDAPTFSFMVTLRSYGFYIVASALYWIESLLWLATGHVKARGANPYLKGPYAPVPESGPSPATVLEGSLPEDLDGLYARIGPNPFFTPIGNSHFFDPDGMTHCLRVKDGKAVHSNRFVKTARLKKEKEVGWPTHVKLGDFFGIGGTLVSKIDSLHRAAGLVVPKKGGAGTANTALVMHAKKLLALQEADLPYHLRVLCEGVVETVGRLDSLEGQGWEGPFTAHPKVCPKTGELHFFGYRFDSRPYMRYGALDPKGALMGQAGVHVPLPSMSHDCGLTESYLVLLDVPLGLNGARMVKEGTLLFGVEDRPLRFGLAPRIRGSEGAQGEGGKKELPMAAVQWFDTYPSGAPLENNVVMHVGNAWEEQGGAIVKVLCCTYARFDLDLAHYDRVTGGDPEGQGDYTEFTLDRDSGRVTRRCLTPPNLITDFPRINEAHLSLPSHRFTYLATIRRGSKAVAFDGIVKVDHTIRGEGKGVVAEFKYPEGAFGGEAVFIPRPESIRPPSSPRSHPQDAGYLATFVREYGPGGLSYVEMLDAATLGHVCRVGLPTCVPHGFHGAWVSGEELEGQEE